jgi:Kelch motif
MAGKREAAAAALLGDGTVLVAGGRDAHLGGLLNTTERYDPASGAWSDAGTMSIARAQHTLTALADGRALVVGGNLGGFAGGSNDVERFSAATTNLTPLTFAGRAIGSTSDAQSAVLTNTGAVPVDVRTVAIAGGAAKDFAIAADTCSAATIAPGDTCAIDVTFTPGAAGARVATLTVSDTTAGGATSATLSGSGPAPASTADGTPAAGAQSAPSAPSAPTAPASGGAAAAPKTGIAVGPATGQTRHRATASATCRVSTAHRATTVTCTVAWPATKAVALRARLMRGTKVVARGRATVRGGRAVVRLRPAARLRAGRYKVAIAGGATVLRSAVRVK